jgi:hypothetical protein
VPRFVAFAFAAVLRDLLPKNRSAPPNVQLAVGEVRQWVERVLKQAP